MGQYNPVVGMTFPIHKNIMLNNIFDKGAIPKYVATSPKFTVSMETRWLIDPETGEKIDMWREQYKMTAKNNPSETYIELTLTLDWQYSGDRVSTGEKFAL